MKSLIITKPYKIGCWDSLRKKRGLKRGAAKAARAEAKKIIKGELCVKS